MQKVNFTVKSYMIIFLIIIALHSIIIIQNYNFLVQLIIAPVFAAIIDLAITYAREKKTFLPGSAVISGLFIALILPLASVLTLFLAAMIAILSKHIIKIKGRHIFNPAAFGIVIVGLLLGYTASWWAAVSVLTLPFGLFIAYKQRKWILAFSSLIVYFLLIATTNISSLNNLTLLDTTAIFFAFFMLIEPMTSAYTKKAMIAEGVFCAVLVAVFRIFLPQVDLFLASLLIVNIFVPLLNKRLA